MLFFNYANNARALYKLPVTSKNKNAHKLSGRLVFQSIAYANARTNP
ncbi:hypothetical protein PCARR_a2993 [Pseudoalteromonas carrageenovora IAM 12662]|uniref:Uncharacterized protein n=1 Tax=Pseudoalteromonas carrageenovora IAM 12662 TaxID=1314868 RepID=A0ABR9EPQ9_PSEVC|nr:hypothetical protein [Pseudoalteromonas carrageenovora IAM 12662]